MNPEVPAEFFEVQYVVEPNYQGWRLDRYLCEKIPRLSRSKIQHLIRDALRADIPLKPSTSVKAGQHLWLRRPVLSEPPTSQEPVRVVWEDDDLLVVDKPAGLPMHPTARYFKGTLVARLREMTSPGDKLDPAHRLDRETSGLVLCGKKPKITGRLKMAFAAGRVKKAYLAIVEGDPSFEEVTVDAPLLVGSEVVRIKVEIDPVAGKPAVTDFRVISRHHHSDGARFALIRAEPHTGRQHQIRVHLAHLGLPLVGDKIYGADERCFIRFTEGALDADDHARLRLPRHALHAAELAFQHPGSGRAMQIASPLPADLVGFLAAAASSPAR